MTGNIMQLWCRMIGRRGSETAGPTAQISHPAEFWGRFFHDEEERIRGVCTGSQIFLDHVGSTSVPKLPAKAAVDILITLPEWTNAGTVTDALHRLGYAQRESIAGSTPRIYFEKPKGNFAAAFHLHLVPAESNYGRDMLIFRDALRRSPRLVRRYARTKHDLAQRYPDGVDRYTAGKSSFVQEVLAQNIEAFSVDRLLTRQRAELDAAQALRFRTLVVQLVLAGIAAASVFVVERLGLLFLALIGLGLTATWLWLAHRQRTHKGAGDQARRIALFQSGLGTSPSPAHLREIFSGFTAPVADGTHIREADYFTSRAAHGPKRLAEMIEESAFWTRSLQSSSAKFLGWLILLGFAGGAAATIIAERVSAAGDGIAALRFGIALLIFLLSSDILGALLSHWAAANAINQILARITTAAALGYKDADILLIATDYNAAVEAAPSTLPFVYQLRQRELGKMWQSYLAARQTPASPSVSD